MDGHMQSDPSMGRKEFKHVAHQQLAEIKNFQKDLLNFRPEENTVTFESETDPEGTLYLDTYNELPDHEAGLSVAISYRIGNRNYILCVENNSVTIKESELPDSSLENSEFIFYLRDSGSEDTTKCTTFESSMKKGFFLACSDDGQNLILKPHTEDDVAKTTLFLVTYSNVEGFKWQELKENLPYHIMNSHDDFLTAYPEESLVMFETDGHAKGEQAMFYMNMYRELALSDGLPVIFSCKVDNKNYLLCVESNSVIIKEGELPAEIPTETSEYIFYVKEFSNGHNAYRFESSVKLEQKCCLAWDKNDSKKKLVLKPYSEGGINELINFFLEGK